TFEDLVSTLQAMSRLISSTSSYSRHYYNSTPHHWYSSRTINHIIIIFQLTLLCSFWVPPSGSVLLKRIMTILVYFLSFFPTVFQTCPKDWIQFKESCYFFYNLNSQWKTWNESRQFCQSSKSDLVVISSLEEQNFIKNKIQYYYDTHHGYWIGLQKLNNNWIWVDGSPDTLGPSSPPPSLCGMLEPQPWTLTGCSVLCAQQRK
uniref:C-type lectin domain-containing protein n=1 Tax=Oryzias latipes TaxID=8090 RepID=A0A3P9IF39_ORYLA